MKTADLIPFILLELAEGDKYGFELTKDIETKSNGLIVIKQPTLYTVLKKLEKSKFISSYWEDSEIGGKRHYYKLTENGKLQLSTFPSYQTLLKNISNEGSADEPDISSVKTNTNEHISIMNALVNDSTPVETILPTEEVFADESIDNATELSINENNSEILQKQANQKHEEFATNTEVAKFAQQTKVEIPEAVKTKIAESKEKIDILQVPANFTTRTSSEPIKYVDYVDIKSSPSHIKSKKVTKNMLSRVICSSVYLLLMVILSTVATRVYGTSPLYNVFLIMSVITVIFYPIGFVFVMEKFRLKVQDSQYKNNLKMNFFVSLGIFLIVLVICILVNIYIGNGSIGNLFSFNNFANFYGPLLFTSSVFADLLFNYIFMKKLNK